MIPRRQNEFYMCVCVCERWSFFYTQLLDVLGGLLPSILGSPLVAVFHFGCNYKRGAQLAAFWRNYKRGAPSSSSTACQHSRVPWALCFSLLAALGHNYKRWARSSRPLVTDMRSSSSTSKPGWLFLSLVFGGNRG